MTRSESNFYTIFCAIFHVTYRIIAHQCSLCRRAFRNLSSMQVLYFTQSTEANASSKDSEISTGHNAFYYRSNLRAVEFLEEWVPT